MIRQSVGQASSWAQVGAALLLAAVGVRFAVAGLLFAIQERAPKLGDPTASSASAAPPDPAPPPVPTGPRALVGTPLRLSIVVNAEQDRSEVMIDGVHVGNTPYVGEVSCKAGQRIKIDVLPPKGAPDTFERVCAPGQTLHVGR
jgi:hypothetical protein